jgi:hypothetical protein
MTIFLRLLGDKEKISSLSATCSALRTGLVDGRTFQIAPDTFRIVPGAPFAYWVSDAVRRCFIKYPPFESGERIAIGGLKTLTDERFLRIWWEPCIGEKGWFPLAKGGKFSRFYAEISLVVDWRHKGEDISWYGYQRRPREGFGAASRGVDAYHRPGLTWPRRTNGLSLRVMPRGCVFADKGPAAFVSNDASQSLLSLCAIGNSEAFGTLVSVQLARVELAQSFEVGLIQLTPVPDLTADQATRLARLARQAWSLKRKLDTVDETSHAFLLPTALRANASDYNPPAIEAELARIYAEIDSIAFDLYGFGEPDRAAAQAGDADAIPGETEAPDTADDDIDDYDSITPIDETAGLLSWAVGAAFGRFDWRLATRERAAPAEPDPFDALPAKSPGMLPDGAESFHLYAGILVDDPNHKHDLARLIEEVLTRVDVAVPPEVRRWLRREFFPFHLQRYSKSRRKAPIYWPLATASGDYALWLYYPDLNSQTLYTAINEFIEPKLEQVVKELTAVRNKGSARNRDDDRAMEALHTLKKELVELRDTMLQIAPTYRPNNDDGVQITAAPLWPLFRHKPWHKLLKETWAKLEKGDYDWSHLAMAYWPDRVREKCKTDKSLAIAHGLEALYEPPPESSAGPGRGGRRRRGAAA